MRMKHAWIPDVPDIRDRKFATKMRASALPTSIDLRDQMPAIWNQGQIGSCVAQSVAALHYAAQVRAGDKTPMTPSRLFVYYNARKMQGWQGSDTGCFIRDAIKSVVKQGAAIERLWPYKVTQYAKVPPVTAYSNALLNQGLEYQSIDNTKINSIKAALAEGLPVSFGSMLYESFYDLKKHTVSMPKSGEKTEGGHAMLIVGYCDARQCFLIRNSWGNSWGDKGYFWMPYEYIISKTLSDDFWILKSVELT